MNRAARRHADEYDRSGNKISKHARVDSLSLERWHTTKATHPRVAARIINARTRLLQKIGVS